LFFVVEEVLNLRVFLVARRVEVPLDLESFGDLSLKLSVLSQQTIQFASVAVGFNFAAVQHLYLLLSAFQVHMGRLELVP